MTKKKVDDIQFEISFYEKLLLKRPHFFEALVALGDLYTKEGFYEKGLAIDKRLSQLKPQDSIVFYNLACSYSLLNQIDASLDAIKKAIELGYSDFEYIHWDDDLINLREDPRFKEYFKKVKP